MMILGSADSKRLQISAFLFLQLWKLMTSVLKLRNDGVDFFLCEVLGEELEIGGPGLEEHVVVDESSALKELLVVSVINDSNKLVEKFGMPQLSQCHEILLWLHKVS
jgi:hypothetical protein